MLTPLGKELRKLRIDRDNMTLRDMAREFDMTPSWVSAIETGKKDPTETFMSRVAGFFELSPEKLKFLEHLAEISTTKVQIDLKGKSEEERDLAVMFARKFPSMEKERFEQLREFLGGVALWEDKDGSTERD